MRTRKIKIPLFAVALFVGAAAPAWAVAPVLNSIGAQSVAENGSLTFGTSATDTELDSMFYAVLNIPANATFVDSGNGSGSFTFNPDSTQENVYNVTFIINDTTGLADTEVVAITVSRTNIAPALDPIGAKNVAEKSNLNFTVTASDFDGDPITLSATGVPTGASFTPGTGVFNWTPDSTQQGIYNVTFKATDSASAVDSEVVTITVTRTNIAPVLDPIGAKNVAENANLNFTVTASDFDGDPVTLSATGVPTGATFTPGTGVFDWTPGFTDQSIYQVTFKATDSASAVDSEVVTITVTNTNRPPVLNAIGAQSVAEKLNLNFTINGSDPDSDPLTFSATGLPSGATFTPATRVFNWTPDSTQQGVYNVTFKVTDTGLAVDSEVVAITVTRTNIAPVLDPIGAKNVAENVNLNFTVTASDFDGDPITLSVTGLPSGATFTPGTGVFNWTPGFTQAGIHNVTFRVTDSASAFSDEVVTITVTNTNRPPVLNAIGAQSVAEKSNLNFTINGTDPDSDPLTFSATGLPAGATFTPATRVFNWTPDSTQQGVYNVTFKVTDTAAAVDSEVVAITVTRTNIAPVLNPIGAKSVAETVNLNFTVTASDFDADPITLSATGVPAGATFTPGTGVFNWTPGLAQQGVYNVTFKATDSAAAVDSEVVTITVTNANQAPVLNPIGAKNVAENANLNFTVTASDADSDPITLSATGVPTGASFTPGTGVFNWTPGFTQAGAYNVTFKATDTVGAVDSEVVTITVTNTNRPPVLTAIGAKSVAEKSNLNFTISGSDPDSDPLTYSATGLPTGATFTPATRVFNWTPDSTQQGVYNVTFKVTDTGLAVDSEVVAITVTRTNIAPVLNPIGAKNVAENANLNFTVTASDFDSDPITLSATGVPAGASFTPGTGVFNWTPGFAQAGSYNVTFKATDSASAVDSEVVTITVTNTNRPPVLNAIGAKSVAEKSNLNFTINGSDPDSDPLTFSATGLPSGATFTPATRVFNWTPDSTQQGVYNVTFKVTDTAAAVDSEVVAITVTRTNIAPVLNPIGAKSVAEKSNLNFVVTASDFDGDPITLSATGVPAGATFTPGTGVFNWTPDTTQQGVYNVTFKATDSASAVDSEVVAITVTNTNAAPVLAAIGSKSIAEKANLNFGVSASDIDGGLLTLTTSTLPPGASFVDNTNGTGTFNWTPDSTQQGSYSVTFRVIDAGGLRDTEIVSITVTRTNIAPVLNPIGTKNVAEKSNLNFTVTASDFDGDPITLSATGVPAGATFTPGTGVFNWTPDSTQQGVYNVTFKATDSASAVDSEVVSITVTRTNVAPVLNPIGAKSVAENVNLNFTVTATDFDGDPVTLSASGVPAGATFTSATGVFNWTPGFTQEGLYNVTFRAVDSVGARDSEIVAITVTNSNRPPVLAAIGAKSVAEKSNLNFTISGSDPDSDPLTYSATGLPSGATFTPATRVFNWTPDSTQQGIYNVTFKVTDTGLAVDSEVVAITVTRTNVAPVLTAIGPKTVGENVNLNFTVTASDFDGDPITLSATGVPSGASFTPGTGVFNWTPTFTQEGIYNVTFKVTDTASAVDSEVVTITVTNTNRPPVQATIGNRSVVEGGSINFSTSATDPDGAIPQMLASGVPANASYVDNGNGTGSFSFSPVFTQAGAYPVIFYASDGNLADSETVTITVLEAGNQTPVLDSIGAKTVQENSLLQFRITASDPDGTIPAFIVTGSPVGAVFVDSGNGRGSYTFTPTYLQSGVYSVKFVATDGAARDSEFVQLTVTNRNIAPILATIGPKSTNEGVLLAFNISSSDSDGTSSVLTTSSLPLGASFVDSLNGRGRFSWTPNFTQAGSYNITFRASDGSLTDSEVVTITVTEEGNQAPVLAAIGSKSVAEKAVLSFRVSATDPDFTTPSLFADSPPAGAVFTDSLNGAGSFVWTPDSTQQGTYNVRFRASDGVLADTEMVTITVTRTNIPPVLAPIGAKSVAEKSNLSFTVTATDFDGDPITRTASGIPAGAAFNPATGVFSWTPDSTREGLYNVTFRATDSAGAVDSEVVPITVTHTNIAPILAAIGPKSVAEKSNLNFTVTATDFDGDPITRSATGVPLGASFTPATGVFNWTPDSTQEGLYSVTFKATDSAGAVDSEVVSITVTHTNIAPILASIGPKSVNEGANLNFGVSATDFDLNPITLTTSTRPLGATFVDNGNGTGTFNWTPDSTQSGVYSVTFRASDGQGGLDSEIVSISVGQTNTAPVLAAIGAKNVAEKSLLSFGVSATDFDGDSVAMTTSTLPSGAVFTQTGDGTGTFSWTPDSTQQGTYNVTFRATDVPGGLRDTEIVTITVTRTNIAPILATIGPKSVAEKANLNFTVTATDFDGDPITRSATGVPLGATFTPATGVFNWTPDSTQEGLYSVTFKATDSAGAVDSEVVSITVTRTNIAPVLAFIGPKSVAEGVNLNFSVSATDFDLDPLTLTTSTRPAGATFVDNGNGTGTFNWTPDSTQAGVYSVTFRASDGAGGLDTEIVSISVGQTNTPPVLAAIGSKNVAEKSLLSFGVSATDFDGDVLTLTTSTRPAGANFVDNGNGTGTFTWTPDSTQEGSYNITFRASDLSSTDSEVVTITVSHTNVAPILAAIGPKIVAEGVNVNFGVTAADFDSDSITMTTSTLPSGATFVQTGDGTGTFNWTPSTVQEGVYNITFRAIDVPGGLRDTEIVTITVTHSNLTPVLAAIGPKSTPENVNLGFNVSATDGDSDPITLTTSTLPSGATFVDSGNGTGRFSWTPGFTQEGSYPVTFRATDTVGAVDSEVVTITVTNSNRPPVLAAIGAKSVAEKSNLNFTISATDPDSDPLTYSAVGLPAGATFTPATRVFDWTPDSTQQGSYNVRFIVADTALAADSELVTITVTRTNIAPVLNPIGPKAVAEKSNLNFTVTATDFDADPITLSASGVPSGATFTPATGVFNWTPDSTQSGLYSVTFRATDSAGAVDSEVVSITVTETNTAPVLAAIGAKSVAEKSLLSFGVSATDFDGDSVAMTTSTLPSGAVFTQTGDGTGTFSWTPDSTQQGTYNVTFRATDVPGGLRDTEIVTITVTRTNIAPILATIGPKSVAEKANLNFTVTATDFDGDPITRSATGVPLGATFTPATGVFNWTPDSTQEGLYSVTFKATDSAGAVDSEVVSITVTRTNIAPILAAIGPKSVAEKQLLTFPISASDFDLDSIILSTSTRPAGANFVDNGNGSGTFTWIPDSTQEGIHIIVFRATDLPGAKDTEIVTITVTHTNVAPVLAAIGPQFVVENTNLNFAVTAADIDPDVLTLTTSALPSGATFQDLGGGAGNFDWTPNFAQSGVYNVTFRVADQFGARDSEIVTITVTETDRPPVLNPIGAKGVLEGQLLAFNVTATDPDGNPIALTTTPLPSGAIFVDSGNGVGRFTWTPSFTQAGAYIPTFYATAAGQVDSELVPINVGEAGNQTPVLNPIGTLTVAEGALLAVRITATDADGTPAILGENLPAGALLFDSGNGSAALTWTPDFFDAGSYLIRVIASDGNSADSESVTINVTNTNRAPVLAAIGPQTATEGDSILFRVSAQDPDSSIPLLLVSGLPAGATLFDSLNGAGHFFWVPGFAQAGVYNVLFRASDGVLADSETVQFTILEAGNQPPAWTAVNDTVIVEGNTLRVRVTAFDPDGPSTTLTSAALPTNATFADSGNGIGGFVFSPNFAQAGFYPITLYASDGTGADTMTFNVIVSEAGEQPPVFDSIPPQTVLEGGSLSVRVHATDPEGTTVQLAASGLPLNATFIDSGNGSGALAFNPTYLQAGVYSVTLLATDNGAPPLSALKPLQITVTDVNRPPIFDSIGPRTAAVGDTLRITVRAKDTTAPAGNLIFLTTGPLPTGATFVDQGGGIGLFKWAPTDTQLAPRNVTFNAIDNGTPALSDQEVVPITVVLQNRAPVLNSIGPKITTEGQLLQFLITATDPDGTIPQILSPNLPPTATLVDQGNGTAIFSYTVAYCAAGLVSIEFRASDGLTFDKEIVLIQVSDGGNQAPVFAPLPPDTIVERDSFVAAIVVNDPDAECTSAPPITVVGALPANATFVDSGDGTGYLTFVPYFTQEGNYTVVFATSDGALVDTIAYQITVLDIGNQSPTLTTIPDQTFQEAVGSTFDVSGSDVDGTIPLIRAANLPAGASFNPNAAPGLGRFSWTPTFTQGGTYQITTYAKDAVDTTLYDSQLVTIIVQETYVTPVWNPLIKKAYSINEGNDTLIVCDAFRFDTVPFFRATYLPRNATYSDLGGGISNLFFQPDYFQAGTDSVVLLAIHPVDTTKRTPLKLTFTINNVSQPPIWRSRADTTVTEGQFLRYFVAADDPDGTNPTLSAQNLPIGAVFTIVSSIGGTSIGRIEWTPAYNQQGVWPMRFIASDGAGADTTIVNVTVLDAGNRRPVFTVRPTGGGIILGETKRERVVAKDPDSTIPVLNVVGLPANATFVDSGGGVGGFTFTPTLAQVGSSFIVRFRASDGSLVDSVTVTYMVSDYQRGDANGDQSISSADVIFLVNYIFKSGPVPNPLGAGDVNNDGSINLSDVIYLVNYVFKGGPPPPF